MLINALWADQISTKNSIWMSPFQLVYGVDVVFPISLGFPMWNLLQESKVETNDLQRRINQTIHLQQYTEAVYNKTQLVQANIKNIYDRTMKEDDF